MSPDCVVGDADVPAKLRLASTTAPDAAELRGDVFLARCDDPARWLRELARRRACAQIRRAIVVLPATLWAEWFGQFENGDCLLCFLRDVRDADGNGVVLAHIGERTERVPARVPLARRRDARRERVVTRRARRRRMPKEMCPGASTGGAGGDNLGRKLVATPLSVPSEPDKDGRTGKNPW